MAVTAETSSEAGDASGIHENRLFFDSLVDMVPAHIYFPHPVNSQGWKHAQKGSSKRAADKQLAKERSKKAKRAKLDPSTAKTSLTVLKEQLADEKKEQAAGGEEGGDMAAGGPMFSQGASRAKNYEELRQRLQQRLVSLRHKRHADEASEKAAEARKWRQQQQDVRRAAKLKEEAERKRAQRQVARAGKKEKARERGQEEREKKQLSSEGAPAAAATPGGGRGGEKGGVQSKSKDSNKRGGGEAGAPSLDLDLNFGRLEGAGGPGGGLGGTGGGKVTSKVRRAQKEKLLAQADAKQEHLGGTKDDGERQEGEGVVNWGAALGRAAGQKVLDNPQLLRRSVKKAQKAKAKSGKQWAARQGQQRAAMRQKQETRKEHLQARVSAKKEARIAKREKKLMRPGFEGRKAGFINASSSGAGAGAGAGAAS